MTIRTLAHLSIAALLQASTAWGQEAETDELARWIPSLGMSIGIVRHSGSAVQQNNLRPPDDGVDPPEIPGTPSSGSDAIVDPLSVFTVELMTPGIGGVPTHPRLFVHGEVGGAFGSEVELVKEGSPGEFKIPAGYPNIPGIAIGGQGTKTTLEISTLMSGGGVGIAFTTDLLGRRLRLKPSFEYLRDGVEVDGVLRHVTDQLIPGSRPPQRQVTGFVTMVREEERTLDSIGGGLELEMDTLRAGPFVIALFANGQAYQLLSDRKIQLFATDGTNVARWDAKLDTEIYRGSVGLRFRFFPQD